MSYSAVNALYLLRHMHSFMETLEEISPGALARLDAMATIVAIEL